MRSVPELILEMRKRRVFRSAGIYIVTAWVVLQVCDLAFESWGFPDSTLRYIWIAAVVGLPIAIFLSWRFDIVDGRPGHHSEGVADDHSLTRVDYLILGALALLVVGGMAQLSDKISGSIDDSTMTSFAGDYDPLSIAVLPFSSGSADREEVALLAFGIQDDLLTKLSKISDFKVISRTSTERYRNSDVTAIDIGRELGVLNIVEGAVQRAGDNIRVNVQLVDTSTDQHLWAETYNRTLTASNIFHVQSEVVDEISRELRLTLTEQENSQLATVPTLNLDAYTSYILGKQMADLESIESLDSAIQHFTTAIELDSQFALAYAALADAYLLLGFNFNDGMNRDEAIAFAEPAVARALSLDENLGQAHATLGFMYMNQGKYADAERSLSRALELAPGYSKSLRTFGRLRWNQGRGDEALQFAQTALDLDPFYAPANFDVARYNDVLGNFDEAMRRYNRVVEIRPGYAFAYVYIAAINYMAYGRADESLVWYHKAARNDALSASLHSVPAIAYIEIGDYDAARYWVRTGMVRGPDTFFAMWTNVLLNLAEDNEEAALRQARLLLEAQPKGWPALMVLRDADIASQRADIARLRYERSHPELFQQPDPPVSAANYMVAADIALIMQLVGEHDAAELLLQRALEVTKTVPRLGTDGHWITDVRILALQGRPDEALHALREAVDSGWRVLSWYYLDRDPSLASLRDLPEFVKIRNEVRADLEQQAERVRQLTAAGDLTSE